MTAVPVVRCESVVRIYRTAGVEVQALQGLDLVVPDGELLAVVGASGSGKSTLLGVLSGADRHDAGRVVVAGQDLARLRGAARTAYRRGTVGVVRQQAAQNLLPYLSAAENVAMPMAFAGVGRGERRARTAELLELLGVAPIADRRPAALSGGEQQRVAIAVALANRPRLLLADEPTGSLDSASGELVIAALRTAHRETGTTAVVVTHDQHVADAVGRSVAIRDGRTSVEVLHRQGIDEQGGTIVVREEYAMLDRAGRLQLPDEYRRALGLRDRVRLDLETDHVAVRPDTEGDR